MKNKPIIVVGDGWAALGSVAVLVSTGKEVCWLTGSGARILPPLASMAAGPSIDAWLKLLGLFGIQSGEMRQGTWIKEHRNKSFREPAWVKGATPENRNEIKNEYLWLPEQRFLGTFEVRFDLTLCEMEEALRRELVPEAYPNLKAMNEVPMQGIHVTDGRVDAVILGSGERLECESVLYADRWGLLPGMDGMPKLLPFLRKREPSGVLQAVFTHSFTLADPIQDSFFAPLQKSGGDVNERHVWGYFTADGKRSVWSICLPQEEVEDNHEIAKRLRKLKSTLDKIFEGSDLIPMENRSLSETVVGEQVRFEEDLIFSQGDALEQSAKLPQIEGIEFLTDGYGFSSALRQVDSIFGITHLDSSPQAEDVNLSHPNP